MHSSARKLKQFETELEKKQMEMKFLDKQSSKQYSQVMQNIMKTNLRRNQSRQSLSRNKSSKQSLSKTINRQPIDNDLPLSSARKELFAQQSPIQIKSKQDPVVQSFVAISTTVRQERVSKKIPYKLSLKSLAIQIFVGYAVTFALLYLIKLGYFPYFQIILSIAFTASLQPWRVSNVLVLIGAMITIGNNYLGLSFFTYPSIIISYYSVLVFNEKYKIKQLFVLALIFTIMIGMLLIPLFAHTVYKFSNSFTLFTFLYPLISLLLRTVISYLYWSIGYTASLFLQLPLFFTGLQYGMLLTQQISSIQFWYLMVMYSLQIVNQRTHFLLNFLVFLTDQCSTSKQINSKPYSILSAHSNGYSSIHSFHLFILIYVYSGLSLYTAPYGVQDPVIKQYMTPWYKPIIIWLLTQIYQILGIILAKNKKNIMFFGYTSNKWWKSMLRGLLLVLGMWSFYLGLLVGAVAYNPIF